MSFRICRSEFWNFTLQSSWALDYHDFPNFSRKQVPISSPKTYLLNSFWYLILKHFTQSFLNNFITSSAGPTKFQNFSSFGISSKWKTRSFPSLDCFRYTTRLSKLNEWNLWNQHEEEETAVTIQVSCIGFRKSLWRRKACKHPRWSIGYVWNHIHFWNSMFFPLHLKLFISKTQKITKILSGLIGPNTTLFW